MVRWFFAAMIALMIGCTSLMAQSADELQNIEVSDPVHYVRVYVDSDGESHFSDESLPFRLIDYAPPAPPISVSEVFGAENISFISSPVGWFGDWHPAPRRQFILVLVGELEVEVSDGETRSFGSGYLCLVEDTSGKGHRSRIVGSERVLCAAIPLAEEAEQLGRELLEVWGNGKSDLLRNILSPDMVYYVGPDHAEFTGFDEVSGWITHVHSFASDVEVTVNQVHVGPATASLEWVMTGIQSRPIGDIVTVATDSSFTLRGTTIVEVRAGKIVRAADYYNILSFLLQLGSKVELPGGTVME